eukprot:TRINITY_DN4725_c0_g2_i1.p1 TRINITY_DN4725_c0_g2~~TRINITY_DN4725_c0_g2_i1.p1  ORF type:complete len:500 (+),score=116.31 TRINITY_DN4725_c0_g2_i1:60-1559(+)
MEIKTHNNNERQISLQLSSEVNQISTEQQTLLLNANLRAPFFEDEDRAPIDLVAVVDVSGSMRGHIDLVKRTLSFMIDQLGSRDSFCMVVFSSAVSVSLDFVGMDAMGKERAKVAVDGLAAGGGTYLSGGLLTGIRKARTRSGEVNEVCSVLLFTDGEASTGIKCSEDMITAINHLNYLIDVPLLRNRNTQRSKSKRENSRSRKRMQFEEKLVIETEIVPEAEEQKEEAQPSDVPFTIYTFGYGASHNADLLRDIAESKDGMYYYIEHADSIADSFTDCLGGLLSVVGQNIQLEIIAVGENQILDVLVPYKMTTIEDKKHISLNIGDIQSEESKDILVSLQIPSKDEGEYPILKWKLSYFNVLDCEKVETEDIEQVIQVSDNFDDVIINVHVVKQKYRVEVSRTLQVVANLKKSGNTDEGKALIQEKIQNLEECKLKNDKFILELIEDLNDVLGDLEINQTYQLHSKMNMHSRQRNAQGSKSKSRYVTGKKARMRMNKQ